MRIKIFILPFQTKFDGFDDSSMRKFLMDKEIVYVQDYFFESNNHPYLTLVVGYNETVPGEKQRVVKKNRDEWKKHLTEKNIPLFNSFVNRWSYFAVFRLEPYRTIVTA
jgi:hypothetical protein